MTTKDENPGVRNVRLKDGAVFVFPKGDKMDFGQMLRDAIIESGLSQYHLAKLTGIPQAALSNFLAGKDLRLSTFNKLSQVMGFELRQNKSRTPRRVE